MKQKEPRADRQKETRADYEVGYKRPPKHTRFKSGTSGNPQGRRKKAPLPHPREILDAVLSEPIQQGDKTITHLDAIFLSLRARALSGNSAAARKLFDLAVKTGSLPKELSKSLVRSVRPDLQKAILETLEKSGGTTLNQFAQMAKDFASK